MSCGLRSSATGIDDGKLVAEVTREQVHSARTQTLFSYTDQTRSDIRSASLPSRSMKLAGLAACTYAYTYTLVSVFSHRLEVSRTLLTVEGHNIIMHTCCLLVALS